MSEAVKYGFFFCKRLHIGKEVKSRREENRALWSITAKNTDCSTGPLARPFARGTVNDWMAILSVFFSIFDHSATWVFRICAILFLPTFSGNENEFDT